MENGWKPTFTPTQQKIVDLLSDGERHLKSEIALLIDPDGMNGSNCVADHIRAIREKLDPIGQDVACEVRWRKTYYRHVVRLKTPRSAGGQS